MKEITCFPSTKKNFTQFACFTGTSQVGEAYSVNEVDAMLHAVCTPGLLSLLALQKYRY
jgi:hypothetical protein